MIRISFCFFILITHLFLSQQGLAQRKNKNEDAQNKANLQKQNLNQSPQDQSPKDQSPQDQSPQDQSQAEKKSKCNQVELNEFKKNKDKIIANLPKDCFEGDQSNNSIGKLSNTLIAIGPGFIVHGLGHYVDIWRSKEPNLKDNQPPNLKGNQESDNHKKKEDTFYSLLIVQGVSILALGGSYLLSPYQDENHFFRFSHRLLEHGGLVLFLGSWLADVMGTFKGAGSFYEDSTRQSSSRFSLGYRYTMDPLFTLRHHIHTGLKLHFKNFYIAPELNWESQGRLKGIDLDFGYRFSKRKEGQVDFFALGLQMRRWDWSDLGFAQVNGLFYIHWRWHLKNLLSGLGGTSFFQKLGVGIDSYQFTSKNTSGWFEKLNQEILYLSVQSGISINFAENLHIQLSYIQDPTRDVRPIKNGDRLWGIQLISKQSPTIEIQAQTLIGEAWSSWLILNYYFAEIEKPSEVDK
jgi:hypothetical protein